MNSSVERPAKARTERGLGFEGGGLLQAGGLDEEPELFLGRDLVLGPDRPRFDDDGLDEGHGLGGRLVLPARLRERGRARRDRPARPRQVLPDLLGDEGHERMEEPQDAVEGVGQDGLGRAVAFPEPDLGELDVPVAELVPDEVVDEVGRLVELVLLQARVELRRDLGQAAPDPAVGERQLGLPDGRDVLA